MAGLGIYAFIIKPRVLPRRWSALILPLVISASANPAKANGYVQVIVGGVASFQNDQAAIGIIDRTMGEARFDFDNYDFQGTGQDVISMVNMGTYLVGTVDCPTFDQTEGANRGHRNGSVRLAVYVQCGRNGSAKVWCDFNGTRYDVHGTAGDTTGSRQWFFVSPTDRHTWHPLFGRFLGYGPDDQVPRTGLILDATIWLNPLVPQDFDTQPPSTTQPTTQQTAPGEYKSPKQFEDMARAIFGQDEGSSSPGGKGLLWRLTDEGRQGGRAYDPLHLNGTDETNSTLNLAVGSGSPNSAKNDFLAFVAAFNPSFTSNSFDGNSMFAKVFDSGNMGGAVTYLFARWSETAIQYQSQLAILKTFNDLLMLLLLVRFCWVKLQWALAMARPGDPPSIMAGSIATDTAE